MGGLGLPELVVILVIVLVIFGGGKLPAIGDALGRQIRSARKSDSHIDVILLAAIALLALLEPLLLLFATRHR